MAKTKYSRYQDYVIKNGSLVGEFEQMYRDFEDPWEQTSRERWAAEKAVALNFIDRVRSEGGPARVVEVGCGLGHFTERIARVADEVIGVDVSPTAIRKARSLFPDISFKVADVLDLSVYR